MAMVRMPLLRLFIKEAVAVGISHFLNLASFNSSLNPIDFLCMCSVCWLICKRAVVCLIITSTQDFLRAWTPNVSNNTINPYFPLLGVGIETFNSGGSVNELITRENPSVP